MPVTESFHPTARVRAGIRCVTPVLAMLTLAGCAVADPVPDGAGRVAENGTTM